MTDLPFPPAPSAQAQAAELTAAFPQYVVNVLRRRNAKPRFEAVSRDGGSLYCLISDDAKSGASCAPTEASPEMSQHYNHPLAEAQRAASEQVAELVRKAGETA